MGKSKGGQAFTPPKKIYSLTSYVFKYSTQFWIEAITGILYNTIIVFGPILQGKLLDTAVSAKGIKEIINAAILFIGVTILFQTMRFMKRYYVRYLANGMTGDMRSGLVNSILSKELYILEKEKTGDLISRTIGDIDVVVEAVRKTITEIWDTWVLMLAYFVTLLRYDIKITLLASIPIPIVIFISETMRKKVYNRSMAARKATSTVTSQLRRTISGIALLRLFGQEGAERGRLEKQLDLQARENTRASILQNGMGPLYSTLATIGIIIVVALGGQKVISDTWTIGTFTAYLTLFTAMAVRTTTAAKVFNIQQGAKASWQRVCEKLDTIETFEWKSNKKIEPVSISIKNLTFTYPTADNAAVENITFKAPEGSVIGVTGSVGSGKSALALALTGLYPYNGSVQIGGHELRDIPREQLLGTISYTGHDPFIFNGTIKDNITWGDGNIDKLNSALYAAALTEDLSLFEKGVDTIIGEKGVSISGGQKQRIALARALYSESKFLILDDPFSAVDIGTEARIIERLRDVAAERTIIIFSHRLAAFELADLVIVLDKGKVVQQGSHKELSNTKGIYIDILHAQKFIRGEEYA